MDVKCVQEAATEFIFYLADATTVFPIYQRFLFLALSLSLSLSFMLLLFSLCPFELFLLQFFLLLLLHIWIFIMNSPRAVFTINRCHCERILHGK